MGGVCPMPRGGVWLGARRTHLRVFRPKEDVALLGAAVGRLLDTCCFQVAYFGTLYEMKMFYSIKNIYMLFFQSKRVWTVRRTLRRWCGRGGL